MRYTINMTIKNALHTWLFINMIGAILIGCEQPTNQPKKSGTLLIVLGTIQDAGSPHIGCRKSCCKALFDKADSSRLVTALGLFDANTNKKYLFEASPNMPQQLKKLKAFAMPSDKELPDGIFLTHAHIGHYAGLMYLGKEAINSKNVPVYAMPKMQHFLSNNGPWNQLVNTKNIALTPLEHKQTVLLSKDLEITPIVVPHRDEYSETVGFRIQGPNRSVLFIPDIDKWGNWEIDIIDTLKNVDYAFLDATFYSGKEVNFRDISEIPHPFIIETMALFKHLPKREKEKIFFIHLNHTNPALDPNSEASRTIEKNGFRIAHINQVFDL